MDIRMILVLALVPAMACAAPAPKQPANLSPPGLNFKILSPKPAPGAPKALLELPRELRVRVTTMPTLPVQPSAPKPPIRLLVFRDDDREATRTVHPFLTPEIRVELLPAQPSKPNP